MLESLRLGSTAEPEGLGAEPSGQRSNRASGGGLWKRRRQSRMARQSRPAHTRDGRHHHGSQPQKLNQHCLVDFLVIGTISIASCTTLSVDGIDFYEIITELPSVLRYHLSQYMPLLINICSFEFGIHSWKKINLAYHVALKSERSVILWSKLENDEFG